MSTILMKRKNAISTVISNDNNNKNNKKKQQNKDNRDNKQSVASTTRATSRKKTKSRKVRVPAPTAQSTLDTGRVNKRQKSGKKLSTSQKNGRNIGNCVQQTGSLSSFSDSGAKILPLARSKTTPFNLSEAEMYHLFVENGPVTNATTTTTTASLELPDFPIPDSPIDGEGREGGAGILDEDDGIDAPDVVEELQLHPGTEVSSEIDQSADKDKTVKAYVHFYDAEIKSLNFLDQISLQEYVDGKSKSKTFRFKGIRPIRKNPAVFFIPMYWAPYIVIANNNNNTDSALTCFGWNDPNYEAPYPDANNATFLIDDDVFANNINNLAEQALADLSVSEKYGNLLQSKIVQDTIITTPVVKGIKKGYLFKLGVRKYTKFKNNKKRFLKHLSKIYPIIRFDGIMMTMSDCGNYITRMTPKFVLDSVDA